MGHRLIRVCVLAAVALSAVGCNRETPATAAPQPKSAPQPRAVRLVTAAEQILPQTVQTTGTLAADEEVALGAKVAGRLGEIGVDLGSRVKKGQVIGRIDPSDYQLRLDQAEAALQQARARLGLTPDGTDDRVNPVETAIVRQAHAQLEEAKLTRDRTVRLWNQDLVARAQLDSAEFALQVAEGRYQDAIEEVRNRQAVLVQRRSEVALARQQLADTAIVSPLDGSISQKRASAGEYLAAGTPVVTVVRTHPLRLRLTVPEREAAGVRGGQAVRVTIDGDPTAYGGTVARLSPQITEQNRTLLIEAEVPNERRALRPGSFAKAEIVTEADQKVVTVPASAIVVFAGVEKVIGVKDGKSVEMRVETGRRQGDQVEIVSGLRPGEAVVTQPGNLAGGQAVRVEK